MVQLGAMKKGCAPPTGNATVLADLSVPAMVPQMICRGFFGILELQA